MIYFIKQVRRNGIKTYYFQKMKTVRPFRRNICSGILTLDNAPEEQIHSQNMIEKLKNLQKSQRKNNEKHRVLITKKAFLEEDKKLLMVLKTKYL